MHTPPRALLLAFEDFLSGCSLEDVKLNDKEGVIDYRLEDTDKDLKLSTGKDIVIEFEGERGLSLLENILVINRLSVNSVSPIFDKRYTQEEINDFVYLCIARLDLERKFSEALSIADTYETVDEEILVYATDDKEVKKYFSKASKNSTDLLLTGYMLRRGYDVTEVLGDCIVVYTPGGSKRVVDDTGCDCMEYALKRGKERCAHLVIADFYMRHRKAFHRGKEDFEKLIKDMKV